MKKMLLSIAMCSIAFNAIAKRTLDDDYVAPKATSDTQKIKDYVDIADKESFKKRLAEKKSSIIENGAVDAGTGFISGFLSIGIYIIAKWSISTVLASMPDRKKAANEEKLVDAAAAGIGLGLTTLLNTFSADDDESLSTARKAGRQTTIFFTNAFFGGILYVMNKANQGSTGTPKNS